MNITSFTVLIERRAFSKTLAMLASSALLIGSIWSGVAHAQTAQAGKIAADLASAIGAGTTPVVSFAKDVNGVRMVKVLIVSNGSDPDLASLRP